MLEKALVQLLFEGKYEKARRVAAVKVFTSFTNTFFEQIIKYGNDFNIHNLNDIINYGVRTKSLMAVTFKKDMKKTLLAKHYYTLIDINEKFVEIYNPHGRTICVPKTIFFDYLFKFEISYSENKIFMWPEVKTLEEFSESWIALKGSKFLMCVIYDLLVEETDTQVLINLLEEQDEQLKPYFFVFVGQGLTYNKNELKTHGGCTLSFLTEFLTKGKYKIVITLTTFTKFEENGWKDWEFENKTFIRFAASKKCSIKKSVENENKTHKKNVLTKLENI